MATKTSKKTVTKTVNVIPLAAYTKATKKSSVLVFDDGLTVEQVTAIVEMTSKKAGTDEQARVPAGTMASLVKIGLAKKDGDKFSATEQAKTKAREWLKASIAKQKQETKSNAPKKAKPRTSGKVELEKTVKVLFKENPSREGTKAYDFYEMLRKSKTVADYIKLGGSQNYLVWFADRGKIEIGEASTGGTKQPADAVVGGDKVLVKKSGSPGPALLVKSIGLGKKKTSAKKGS